MRSSSNGRRIRAQYEPAHGNKRGYEDSHSNGTVSDDSALLRLSAYPLFGYFNPLRSESSGIRQFYGLVLSWKTRVCMRHKKRTLFSSDLLHHLLIFLFTITLILFLPPFKFSSNYIFILLYYSFPWRAVLNVSLYCFWKPNENKPGAEEGSFMLLISLYIQFCQHCVWGLSA